MRVGRVLYCVVVVLLVVGNTLVANDIRRGFESRSWLQLGDVVLTFLENFES